VASWSWWERYYLPREWYDKRGQPVSEEHAQQNTDAAEETPAVRQEADGQEPDVLLDVSELEVDRINLEVEDLRAHVSDPGRACQPLESFGRRRRQA
jgi:hypothetical protein